MDEQHLEGNHNVQIQGVVGSCIQITYRETTRAVPLEPAHVPVAQKLLSPSRLIRAHAGVIPYVERGGLTEHLETWVNSPAAFSGHVIGGRGGAGKTRLAVELCQRLENRRWLCGFLSRIADQGMLDALVETPTARLVVIDYAETRPEQLELLLPLLSAKASLEFPVRVLLLVRGGDNGEGVWANRLANRVDALDVVLDECEVLQLEDTGFGSEERRALFDTALPALAHRFDSGSKSAGPPDLDQETFASPLMVVVAACLAALGEQAPTTREALLDEVLAHERRYWREGAEELDLDDVLLERLVALATLLKATSEQEAEDHLQLLPYFRDSPAERRNRLARWLRAQYPGPRWWNPLEPDLVGERLVARCFTDQPEVLRGVLGTRDAEQVTRPLEVLARAAADHPRLAEVLGQILEKELEPLCRVAIAQAEGVKDADLLYGKAMTVAAAIDALLGVVDVETGALGAAEAVMPRRPDLVLNGLAVTLTALLAEGVRPLAASDPTFVPVLAETLNNLCNRLAAIGHFEDSLGAIEESVRLRRPLAEADPAYLPDLARALNNLSNALADNGRHADALAAGEESVRLRRPLAKVDPAYLPDLARALTNLTGELAATGHHAEALATIEEAVALYRPLADADSFYVHELSSALHNLSNRLGEAGRNMEALAAIEESVQQCRSLAEIRPSAYAHDLAKGLNNLSNRLAAVGRFPDALAAAEEAIAIFQPLTEANPAAYGPEFEMVLENLDLTLEEMRTRSD